MDFRPCASSSGSPAGKHVGNLIKADGRPHQNAGIDEAFRELFDRTRNAWRRAQDPDRRDVLEHQHSGVDQARFT